MRLTVVDPRILIQAFACPRSGPAKLLALLAYGRVAINAAGAPLEALDEMVNTVRGHQASADLDSRRAWALREVEEAKQRKALMDDAFGQHAPSDLLLAVSPPLLDEATELAQQSQGRGNPHVLPDRVRRHIARHTYRALTELSPAPNYLGRGLISKYDYLIHTAMEAEAADLVTDEKALHLPGDGHYQSERTAHRVRPYSFEDFIATLPYILDFNAIDTHAVLRAASQRISA